MPTYDYQCKTCGNRFEYFQSITADALAHCPKELCLLEDEEKKGTGDVVRRVSGGAGLVFKGEGFYLTDYVRKGEGKKDGGGGSSSESTSSSKSEGSGGSSGSSTGGSASGGSSSGGSSSGDSSKS